MLRLVSFSEPFFGLMIVLEGISYAMGAVDVAVYPYELDAFLRPEVKKLFDQGF